MRGILAVVLATWSFGAATWSLGAQARPALVLTCDPASCALKPGEPGEVLQLGDDGKYHWVKTAPTSIPDCSASNSPGVCALKPGDPGEMLAIGADGKWQWLKFPKITPDPVDRRVLACPIDGRGRWSADLGVCWWEEMPK